jgi:glycosyltransferase involved in cell wall biosynthesis
VTGTIAFVPPRYGPGVVGGAEAVLTEMAHGLAGRGWDVEVLTTCAQDHYTWANHFPAGTSDDGPVRVTRFPIVQDTGGAQRAELHARILAGERLTISEEQLWVNDSMRVPELWHHVLDHGHRYRAIVLAPYMFWTTFAVGQIHPDRTILMPCLHDEPEARLRIFQPLFAGARGIWFLSDPEAELASTIFPLPRRTAVVGAGMDLPDRYDPDGFRRRHGLDGPFIYYAGRREGAKSWPELVDAYAEMRRTRGLDLTLVTSGIGPVDVPDEFPYDGIVDLGFISDDERNDAMAAATAYVQPSALESFSRTVLEAFAAGTAVVANAAGAVVAWHIERTGAGVTYENRHQLVEALAAVAEQPSAFTSLATDARGYVEAHYRPDVVLDQLEELLGAWMAEVPA